MKKNFLAGVAILLPIVLTLMILMFFVNLLTTPFIHFIDGIFAHHFINLQHYFLKTHELLLLFSKIFILFFLFFLTIFIGFLAQHFFAKYLFQKFDYLMHKIPLVNKIYKSLQEVMQTLFTSEKKSFSQVVLVPFPQENSYAIGFVTKESLPEGSDKEHKGLMAIYVPGTPNPMMGFNFLYKKEEVVFIKMKVDDALKFVISCGVMFPGFD